MQEEYIISENKSQIDDIPRFLHIFNTLVKNANVKIDQPFTFIIPMSQFEIDKLERYCEQSGYVLKSVASY